jgi:hypothetical protein
MNISKVLSFLGGYFNANEFELDIPKIADVSELSEEEVTSELQALLASGDISVAGNKVTLIKLIPEISKSFNELYAPVETMLWGKGEKLKLDK